MDSGTQASHTEVKGRVVKWFNLWENYAASGVTFGPGTQVVDTSRGRIIGIAEAVSHLGRHQEFSGCRCETPAC